MALPLTRIGVVRNPRSHANLDRPADRPDDDILWAEPDTPLELAQDMARFAEARVDLIVIDGGDGTVREVLSALPDAYGATAPVIAVLASGKTNVLALDLGAKPGWDLAAVRRRAEAPAYRLRPPLEVSWADPGQPPVRGFILGLGAFARGTEMSKAVHRMGAYHNLSVALTVIGAALGTLFARRDAEWRQGVPVTVTLDGSTAGAGARFVLLATTLKRLPFGLKPFGPPQDGMKVLDVDAPPRRLMAALPRALMGRGEAWLNRHGYRRQTAQSLTLTLADAIVIDGEVFPGGQITVRRGEPLRFLIP